MKELIILVEKNKFRVTPILVPHINGFDPSVFY